MDNASLVNWFLAKFNTKKSTVQTITFDETFDEGKATQADKPSPHSSYTWDDLQVRARHGFQDDNIHCYRVANTNSMEPIFDDNSLVIMETLNENLLKTQPLTEGDIIIYRNSAGLSIIHRLTTRGTFLGKPAWLVKGDNNYFPDGWVQDRQITERLVGVLYGRQNRPGD